MNNSTAKLISWYTERRARSLKACGLGVMLAALGVSFLGEMPHFRLFVFLGVLLIVMGNHGSAIAELKHRAGMQAVSPVIDTMGIIFVCAATALFALYRILLSHYLSQ